VIAAAIGLWAAYVGTTRVRQQTVTSTSRAGTDAESAALRESEAGDGLVGRDVEGYIVRFIILSLVFQLWSSLLNVTSPFLYLGGQFVDLARGAVYALIFLLLGLPLLIDISRRYGIRGLRRPRR
jgi:hypothetical protein